MNIILRYIDICLFKASPADIPSSHWLMKISLLVYLVVGIVISRIDYNWQISLVTSFTELVLMIVVTSLLLQFRGLQMRFTQTITAMAATGSLLGFVGMPVMYFFHQTQDQGQVSGLAMLLLIAIVLWSLMVTAHIFRMALELKPANAVMLTIAYTILSLIIVGLVVSGVA